MDLHKTNNTEPSAAMPDSPIETTAIKPDSRKSKTVVLIRQLIIWLAVYLVITAIWFYSE
jgi:hypothetical protein